MASATFSHSKENEKYADLKVAKRSILPEKEPVWIIILQNMGTDLLLSIKTLLTLTGPQTQQIDK